MNIGGVAKMRVCLYSHQMQISINMILAMAGDKHFASLREHRPSEEEK